MTKLITIIFFSLLISQPRTQLEFETQTEIFIKSMMIDYRIIKTNAKINNYASSGSSWSKRIDLKSNNLFLNKYDQKDYQEYTFTFLYFMDKDSLLKARQDYLDHFSFNGNLTSETKGVKRSPSFNLINDNSLIIFEVSCEGHKMDEKWSWKKIKSNLISSFGTETSEIIENGCGGPIIWTNNRNK